MRALAVLAVAAGCQHEAPVIPRPTVAPRELCPAIERIDYVTASWAMASKLDTIGGRGSAESAAIVRAWLATQPCILAVEKAPCFPSVTPEIEARTRTSAIRVRLYQAGGASVIQSDGCFKSDKIDEILIESGPAS